MQGHQTSLKPPPSLCTFRRSGRRRDRRDPPTRCRQPSPRQTPPGRADRKPHTHSGRGGCSLLLTPELLFEGERVSHSSRPRGRGAFPNTGADERPRPDYRVVFIPDCLFEREYARPKRAPRGWQLAVPVEDRFDVVPVRVNAERCVIPCVVLRAKTRRAVVAAAGFDSGAVELVNSGSVGCGEGHMNGSGRRFPFPDPEISTALDSEPRPLRALHYLHAERLEGLLVERAAASQVTYSQGQVVDEGKRHGQRHALYLRARLRGTFLNTGAGEARCSAHAGGLFVGYVSSLPRDHG